jgi:uncharacterized protein YydD (DUF2326 family)
MADEIRKDLESVISEILIELQSVNNRVEQMGNRMEQMVNVFNTGVNAMLGKMDEFTQEIKGVKQEVQKLNAQTSQIADYEERLRQLERIILRINHQPYNDYRRNTGRDN